VFEAKPRLTAADIFSGKVVVRYLGSGDYDTGIQASKKLADRCAAAIKKP
jgi:hypothetical protein